MTGDSHDLPSVDAITFGTVGQPGSRVFYVQAWAGATIVTLKMEKQQVAGLCAALTRLLEDLPPEMLPTGAPGLRPPIQPEWSVGNIGLSTYDDATQRVTVQFEELRIEDEEVVDGSTARIGVTVAQMTALVERGEELVAGGRPNCPLCGNPMNPDGHTCPKTNGHLKR
jgi:uncharacterized repeat protein (TIGR03847 family)